MRGMQQMVMAVGIVILGGAVPVTPVGAIEEGQTEGSGPIVLECRPGTVTKKITSESAAFTQASCFCDSDPEGLRRWVASLADGWRSGQPLPQPAENNLLVDGLAPGEQREITIYCLSPEQVAAYRSEIMAAEEGSPGEN